MHRSAFALATLAALVAACSSTPKPATPAPEAAAAAPAAPAPAQISLAGEWEIEISSAQQGVISSMIRFVSRGGSSYVGALQPLVTTRGEPAIPGMSPSPIQVRSATVIGDQVTILLDFEGDEGRITAAFRGANRLDGSISSRALSGRVAMRRR